MSIYKNNMKKCNMTPLKVHKYLVTESKDIKVDEIKGKGFKRLNSKVVNNFKDSTSKQLND
jgi:hypothetical protein